jgi:xanthine dehydrogenase accessory factor
MRRFPLGPALGQCCGGVVTLMFEPVAATLPAWVEWAAIRLERRAVVGVATVADGDEAGAKLLCGGGETWTGIADPALSMRAAELAAAAAGPAAAVHWVAGSDGRRWPLLIERWQAGDFHVVLFGAGHVGRALAAVLGQLPCTVLWVDERESEFPDTLAANVTARVTRAHEVVIDESPPAACYVVMTHSHALDESICEHVLGRADFRYCGLIGSVTKRRRFEKRMAARGMGAAALARLTCPIGIAGLTGKHPGEIAVAIAAELLALRARDTVTAPVAGVGRGRGR